MCSAPAGARSGDALADRAARHRCCRSSSARRWSRAWPRPPRSRPSASSMRCSLGLAGLPPVRLEAAAADAGRDGLAVGRHHLHHRLRHRRWPGRLTQSGFSQDLAERDGGDARRRATASSRSRSWPSWCSAACSKAFRPSCCSAHCCSRSPSRSACTKCTTRWSSILAMGIGLFAPPFGVGYYGACAISKVDPDEGMRHIWGYVAALLIGLAVVAAVPWFSIGFLKYLDQHAIGKTCNEPILWRDPAGRLRRARHRGGHGLLEPRARRRAVVLQPAGADRELSLSRRGATSRTTPWRWPIPGRCRWS